MLDDFFGSFVTVVGYLFYRLFIEIFCFYTGEIILSIITCGKKKPRWDYYAEEKPSKFVVLTEISVWLGISYWILVIALMMRFVFSA